MSFASGCSHDAAMVPGRTKLADKHGRAWGQAKCERAYGMARSGSSRFEWRDICGDDQGICPNFGGVLVLRR